ncbi:MULTISPECIES: DUF3955 domain-containing protein [Bacillus]|uniref:DUF3955 domain-containing protein n=1 Tax=Bacillus TaxID=1386 RepID=UPI000BAE8082|nr:MULTISPECIES: DUF3955 domain-containing protein [Bacillus]ASZ18568.1 group-specific protein [Bacillus cereus]MCM0004579.1 DUF3955 domain-containing protein [Bacillus paranthracis]MDA1955058.1 DUF3955 domain-containing protein [Bacillus cereus group sp. BcHK114]
MFFIKKKNQESITNKNLLKNNKFILAITPILLGIACLIISGMVGSSMEPDGTLVEPAFFLIPISYLLFFIGIIGVLFVLIGFNFKKIIHK